MKRLLGRLLIELKKKIKQKQPALDALGPELEKYLNYSGGFFIEVGANDGYSQSNTYFLEKERGWCGILIEAIPDLYKECRQLRSNSTTYNCALVSSNYSDCYITMHYAGLMSLVDGALKLRSAEKKHISRGLKVQYIQNSYTVSVPARTLTSILNEYSNVPEIDFFSLDVEGYEEQVLRGLNLKKYSPKYILVEARFFDAVHNCLKGRYNLLKKINKLDCLYQRKDLSD